MVPSAYAWKVAQNRRSEARLLLSLSVAPYSTCLTLTTVSMLSNKEKKDYECLLEPRAIKCKVTWRAVVGLVSGHGRRLAFRAFSFLI